MSVFNQTNQHVGTQNNIVNETRNEGDTFNMSGDFRGANVNIKSTLNNVTQTIGALSNADDSLKEELSKLIQQLNDTLQQAPAEKAEAAEAVAKTAEVLVQTSAAEKPNKTLLEITGKGLLEASKAVADIMPTALKVATQIVAVVGKITGV